MRLLLALLGLLAWLAAHESASASPGPGRALYLPVVMREASAVGLPPEIADAVAVIETGYAPDRVGSSGEIGLMQVMPATAAQLGFRGSLAELADPAINIHLGVAYLARAWAAGGQDICRALTKYRAGLGQEVATPLSARYCARAVAWLAGDAGRLPDPPDQDAPAPRPDPHVMAMLPPLPEQAGLFPTAVRPALAVTASLSRRSGRQTRAPGWQGADPGRFDRYLPRIRAEIADLAEAQ